MTKKAISKVVFQEIICDVAEHIGSQVDCKIHFEVLYTKGAAAPPTARLVELLQYKITQNGTK